MRIFSIQLWLGLVVVVVVVEVKVILSLVALVVALIVDLGLFDVEGGGVTVSWSLLLRIGGTSS